MNMILMFKMGDTGGSMTLEFEYWLLISQNCGTQPTGLKFWGMGWIFKITWCLLN